MKRTVYSFIVSALLAATIAFSFPASTAYAGEHPRLDIAIERLRDAVAYLREAPHSFGGHKAAAIADCERAIRQLEKAKAYSEHRR